MALSRSTPRGHKLRSKGKAKSFCINSNAINKNSHCCMLARIYIHSATEISGMPKVEIIAILACVALNFRKIFLLEDIWCGILLVDLGDNPPPFGKNLPNSV